MYWNCQFSSLPTETLGRSSTAVQKETKVLKNNEVFKRGYIFGIRVYPNTVFELIRILDQMENVIFIVTHGGSG